MDEATITPYPDGPLIVRGAFAIVDPDGTPIDPGRQSVALCRCGRSAVKPFCDGTHKRARFVSGPSAHRVEDDRVEDDRVEADPVEPGAVDTAAVETAVVETAADAQPTV